MSSPVPLFSTPGALDDVLVHLQARVKEEELRIEVNNLAGLGSMIHEGTGRVHGLKEAIRAIERAL